MIIEKPDHRITNGKCTPLKRLGYEKLQSGFALCAIFSTPHFFAPVKCCAFSLSGTKKRHLPRTLSDNFFTPHYRSPRAILSAGNLLFL
jgi:hypothetical protein